MPAPKGNQFWKKADPDKHGGQREYTPNSLYKACCEYFEEQSQTVLRKHQAFKIRVGKVEEVQIIEIPFDAPNMHKPFTLNSLRLYLGISRHTWSNYRDLEDYFPVVEWAEETVEANQIEGALLGVYSGNLTARINSLADTSNLNHSGGTISFAEDDGVD